MISMMTIEATTETAFWLTFGGAFLSLVAVCITELKPKMCTLIGGCLLLLSVWMILTGIGLLITLAFK